MHQIIGKSSLADLERLNTIVSSIELKLEDSDLTRCPSKIFSDMKDSFHKVKLVHTPANGSNGLSNILLDYDNLIRGSFDLANFIGEDNNSRIIVVLHNKSILTETELDRVFLRLHNLFDLFPKTKLYIENESEPCYITDRYFSTPSSTASLLAKLKNEFGKDRIGFIFNIDDAFKVIKNYHPIGYVEINNYLKECGKFIDLVRIPTRDFDFADTIDKYCDNYSIII